MKKVFITGITGTLGQELMRRFLENPEWNVVGFSRDEFKQKNIPPHERLTLILGDVRDRVRVVESTRCADLIFHCAALKHVDVLELNPEESIATNVLGTENVLYAQRMNKVPRVCLSSTDKAVYPINVYGACKLLSEKLVLRNKNNVVCRWGNIFGSRGSVIPSFVKAILDEKPVRLTHSDMTRFFVRIEDAVSFMIDVALDETRSGLHILPMKACNIEWLIRQIAIVLGKTCEIEHIGLRPGEKIHEWLRTRFEGEEVNSLMADQLNPSEIDPWIRECAGI